MGKKAEYGSGHPEFLEYSKFIATHPNYEGMPDLYNEKGQIQWEAPSNRKSGAFKDSHIKRKAWWSKKAISVGIDPDSNEWISRTAKKIHPTMKKPCKKCGNVMDLRYSYPTDRFYKKLFEIPYLDSSFEIKPLEHVLDLVGRLYNHYGDRVYSDFPKLFKSGKIKVVPNIQDNMEAWIEWIDRFFIPSEQRGVMSPGAMANPPDRLDGFHSFNICCRGSADSGRWKTNLQSYTTDRRAFEYWVDGDWVAADRLMGIIRSDKKLKQVSCLFSNDKEEHKIPCAADHIGPISLGFSHRPQFQFLCPACNSAKNNRMFVSDVQHLIKIELLGEKVVSWYCEQLWNLRKHSVNDKETVSRLCKMLRDNRYTAMYVLNRLLLEDQYVFLSMFLGLEFANRNVKFGKIDVIEHITSIEQVTLENRETLYASEQKARRLRIAFSSLRAYNEKEDRNTLLITSDEIEEKISRVIEILKSGPAEIFILNNLIKDQVIGDDYSEETLRKIVSQLPQSDEEPNCFRLARAKLVEVMSLVAEKLDLMWDDDRYVRIIEDVE
ncbi:Alw26I/Eco31I/Esp3I family type II restriction endonuclease [Paenibacillus jamilae]|nr:Alw26I/Eco31I/Esp3I family type II restriction endonuclease [Paenibacillus jamilae]